jgi:hypothetical protein
MLKNRETGGWRPTHKGAEVGEVAAASDVMWRHNTAAIRIAQVEYTYLSAQADNMYT